MRKMNLFYLSSTLIMLTLMIIGIFNCISLFIVCLFGFGLDTYAYIKLRKSIKDIEA